VRKDSSGVVAASNAACQALPSLGN
jgi:hypothetical protein